MQIAKSKKFLDEYQSFKTQIDRIENKPVKDELTRLLNDLVNEVKSLDKKHDQLMFETKLPESVSDHRNKLVELRKKILSKLEQHKKTAVKS